jgi:hypothetical protein
MILNNLTSCPVLNSTNTYQYGEVFQNEHTIHEDEDN